MRFLTGSKLALLISLFTASSVIGEMKTIRKENIPSTNSYFFCSGSFIYWQPIQSNMKLGVESDSSDPSYIVNGTEVDLPFDYNPGFKVGLGAVFNDDNWDTFVEYTWLKSNDTVQRDLIASGGVVYLLPAFTIPSVSNPRYTFGSEQWKLSLNFIDWDVRRSCSIGKALLLRPFAGLRGALIDQHVYVQYINTLFFTVSSPSTYVTQSAHSWGIGPRAGIYSEWGWGKGWKLRNTTEMDILYTQYDLKNKQTSATSFGSTYSVKQNNAGYVRIHVDLELGLGWGTCFADGKYHVDLSADYGFQVFFDQNMFRNVSSTFSLGRSILPNGNLYIQGLTATARLDF